MRAFQAGKLLPQGLVSMLSRCTAAGEGSVCAQQQWASARISGTAAAGAGLQLQASLPSTQQLSNISGSNSIRSFFSISQSQQLPLHLQQQACNVTPHRPNLSALSILQQQQRPAASSLPNIGSVRHFVLMPRRIKFRKAHKSQGFNETICPNTRQLAFGLYGIRAMEHCRIPARTIEAARRTLRRTIKKTAMLWIRVTPNVPVTSKPAEVRMGKGKGTLDYWAAPVRPGQIIFEMDRCTKTEAQAALKSIQAKMPMKIGFVEWN